MTPAEVKKWHERSHASEAAKLLNEEWDLGPDREEPDFCVNDGTTIFGLEVTYAFSDTGGRRGSAARKSESQNNKRMQSLRALWEATNKVPLKVQVLGQLHAANEHEVLLALKTINVASCSLGEAPLRAETSSGLKVFASRAFRPDWSLLNDSVGWVARNAVVQAQAAIVRKTEKLVAYRRNVGTDVRLLIVADHGKASGMLDLETPNEIDPMGFTKVYFMSSHGGPLYEVRPPSA